MRRLALAVAALVLVSTLSAPARAANPQLVSSIEKYLRDDEKACLAAVLTRPAESAQFDAEAPLALKDPKVLKVFLDEWRGKLAEFASKDKSVPNPNLDAAYSDYAQMLTPEIRAYLLRRLQTMPEGARNDLIGYLQSVNGSLSNGHHLSWYTKKVVAGIMDRYRQDLSDYLATPMGQSALKNGPAAAAQMAQIRADAAAAAAAAAKPKTPAPVASAKPAPKSPSAPAKTPAAPAKTPAAPVKPAPRPSTPPQTVVTGPTGGALQQAKNAAKAGENSGNVFDGSNGVKPATPGSVVTVPPVSGPKPGPVLTKPAGDLTGAVPSVPPAPADQSFMDSIMKLKTGPPSTPWHQHMPTIAGGLLGAVLGFFLGGPLGAVIGAAAGAAAGHFIGNQLFS